MDRRQKDIITMAEQAELTAVRTEKRNCRQFITCRADNGVEREFSVSTGSRSDPRGDQNELSAMKRFARENAEQTPKTQPKPRETLSMTKATTKTDAAATTSVQALTPVDFYRACEWVKAQSLANFPNMEALVLGAAKHIESAFMVSDMQVVMKTIGISEPAHWAEPTDPQTILVRELHSMMKDLGVTASPAFARLTAKLLTAA